MTPDKEKAPPMVGRANSNHISFGDETHNNILEFGAMVNSPDLKSTPETSIDLGHYPILSLHWVSVSHG